MGQTVIGIFENSSDAYEAVEKLTEMGFSRSEIDIAENDNYDRETTDASHEDEEEDSISRFFNNLFGYNEQSKYYSEVSRRSSSIVTVHAQSNEEAERAADILDEYGAVDVDERAAQYGYDTDFRRDDNYDTENREDSRTIPIIEEEMHVGRRDVVTGGVRVRSRIINKPVEETLRLRHESVSVERKPVSRPASEKDMQHFREGERSVTERKEVPVVNKDARVVEEVKINKKVEEREETVRENVRKTQVDVDRHHDDTQNRDISDDDYSDRNREL